MIFGPSIQPAVLKLSICSKTHSIMCHYGLVLFCSLYYFVYITSPQSLSFSLTPAMTLKCFSQKSLLLLCLLNAPLRCYQWFNNDLCTPFSDSFFFLKYTWHTTLVSGVQHRIWCLTTLQNDYHSKSSEHPSWYKVINFYFFWWEISRSFSQKLLNMQYSIINESHQSVHYAVITSTRLIYFITGTLYLFPPFTHFTHSLSLPLATTSLFFVSMSLNFISFCFIS